MLCPEVWKFEASNSSFRINKSDDEQFFSKKGNQNNFYYNNLVSVIIPDSLTLTDSLSEKLIKICEYYKALDLSPVDLMNQVFLISFVKSGLLTLFCVNTRIDCDNYKEITPTGQIVLNVNKETYQHEDLKDN